MPSKRVAPWTQPDKIIFEAPGLSNNPPSDRISLPPGTERSLKMSVITQHAVGTFCWPELHTTDVPAAKKFYGSLFHWAPNDMPVPEGDPYTMLDLGGQTIGAMTPLQKEQTNAGVPPHWNPYVAVANADETAKKATSLGGTVILPPFDVMDAGRMAVIQDPTGATFSV
jgi:predicted enzyme related to lactoylglutathione lyase